MGAEFSYVECEYEKEWLTEHYERLMAETVTKETQIEIAELLLKSQAWDNFLATKFTTVKRYGAEGAESMMAFFRELFLLSVDDGISHVVLGMPHRGRLNLLTTMLNSRPAKIFNKFRGQPEFPSDAKAMCDIASHFRKFFFIFFRTVSYMSTVFKTPPMISHTMGKRYAYQPAIILRI